MKSSDVMLYRDVSNNDVPFLMAYVPARERTCQKCIYEKYSSDDIPCCSCSSFNKYVRKKKKDLIQLLEEEMSNAELRRAKKKDIRNVKGRKRSM
jgi:hypothetical protein